MPNRPGVGDFGEVLATAVVDRVAALGDRERHDVGRRLGDRGTSRSGPDGHG